MSSLKMARTTGVFQATQKMPDMPKDMTGTKMIDSRMSLEMMRLIDEQLHQIMQLTNQVMDLGEPAKPPFSKITYAETMF